MKIKYSLCVLASWREKKPMKLFFFFVMLLFISLVPGFALEHLNRFADPATVWGNGIERFIEEAYRACFRTRIIDGKVMNIRLPFAMNTQRDAPGTGWNVFGGGKSGPEALWPRIEDALDSDDFAHYIFSLGGGREQVVIFDIPDKSWRISHDLLDLAYIKTGSYRGLPQRPYVFSDGMGISESDVYNYLYSIAQYGMDCSGFVWYALTYAARQKGVDLARTVGRSIGLPPSIDPSMFIGTSFFNGNNRHIMPVDGRMSSLRPGDILLFRNPNEDGTMSHSAVIQSVNMAQGLIRYFQITGEAPQNERGVHESFIYFDPANPHVSIHDLSLRWSQIRLPAFEGEPELPFHDDGGRFRAYGGGRVVRMRVFNQF